MPSSVPPPPPRRRLRLGGSLTLAVLCLGLRLDGRAATAAESARADLSSTDAPTAYKAVETILAEKDVGAAQSLLEAGVSTLFPHVSVACGEALAALGSAPASDGAVLAAMQKAAKSKDVRALRNLARVLGSWADPVVDESLAYLASGRRDTDVQAEALVMIGHLGLPSSARPFVKCLAAVRSALDSNYGGVRAAAGSAASRLRDPSLAKDLVDVVKKSQDKYSGLYAVWALARMGHRGDVGSFIHVLENNPKREMANSCLKAITELAGGGDVETLLSLSRSAKKDMRDAACVALGRLAREGLYKPLPEGGTAEPSRIAASAAASKVAERLVQLVEVDTAWEVRDAAARALERMGDMAKAAVVARMPAVLSSSDSDAVLTAIEMCGRFGVKEAYKELLKVAIYDRDPTKRMFASRALGSIDPARATVDLLEAPSKDRKGREATINSLRALGYVRHEDAYKGLVAILDAEADRSVHAETERALERLTGHRFGRKIERWDTWYQREKERDPFHPHLGKFDRHRTRDAVVKNRLYGLSESTELAVEGGLRWLESQQHPEGFWDGNEKGFGGVINCEPAYTGLALLAFLGAGYEGAKGKYHEAIRRATEFLAATQFYDGGFPVTGGGDNSWIFAYLTGMAVWGINEAYGLANDDSLREAAQRGIDYLARVQTPGAGWRYGPRYTQSDTSCTSWVLMTMKTATLLGLEVPQRSFDGIDSWLERCGTDITGEEESPDDLKTDYDKEVGAKRIFKAITGYFELTGGAKKALQQTSMTAVGMVCRFFMGWKRSHPFLIGSANYLVENLPQWRKGLEKDQAIAWYFYYWYYGTLAMHQMGGRFWRAWNEKIKTMLPSNQRKEPPEIAGSWDPDSAVLNGGRIFSTSMAVLSLETYYRFSPLSLETEEDAARAKESGAAMDK